MFEGCCFCAGLRLQGASDCYAGVFRVRFAAASQGETSGLGRARHCQPLLREIVSG